MRIALLHPYPWPEVRRGAERYLEDLSTYLAGHGHEVIVVTGTHGRASRQQTESGALDVRRRHLRGSHRLGLTEVETFGAVALPAVVAHRPEVVHAFVPSAAVAGRLAGRPTLYTVLGHPTLDQAPTRAIPRLLVVQALRRATEVATLSRASAQALAHSFGRQAEVLSPGVDLGCFPPDLDERGGPPIVLLSASLEDRRKRPSLAVEAFALLLRRRPEARLVLSGQGDPEALLQATDSRVRDAIEVAGAGRPDEVPGRYRRASVTVLCATHEAFGLALVESLASGTPVVCTPDGGMPEIVSQGVGKVATSARPEALCEALDAAITLAADPATPRRCVERARRWDWETEVGPAHLEIYEALRSRRRATVALS